MGNPSGHFVIRCEFCEGICRPLYQVGLGSLASTLHQCEHCFSARVAPPFPAEKVAAFYADSYFDAAGWQRKKSAVLAIDYFSKISPFLRGGRSLDVGAGYGDFARCFKKRTGNSMDVVEPSEACRKMMSEQTQSGEVFRLLAELPAGAAYDQIFCFHVVEHLQSFAPFAAELQAKLVQGGRFFILTPNGASDSFREFGREWGWACPDQHHQFLSDQIPAEYFTRHGFRVLVQKSLCPAVIHYPGRWSTQIQRSVRKLDTRAKNADGAQRYMLKAMRRLLLGAESVFAQNRSNHNATFFEMQLSRRKHHAHQDELLLVLEKN